MDLDVQPEDVARVFGRAAVPFACSFDRELTQADLARLSVEQGTKAPSVAKLSDRHHALAKALAQGISPGNAAIITGYSASRISILKADPAFVELVCFYRSEKDILEASVLDRLSNLTLSVVSELEDRLENAPEDLKTRELLDIAVAGLDRTGHGPSSKVQVTSLTLTAEQMEKLSQGSRDPNVKVIEARPADRRPAIGNAPLEITLAATSAPGLAGEGDGAREISGESTPGVDASRLTLRTVDTVHGLSGNGACSTRSLSDLAIDGDTGGMQTETEHLSRRTASSSL